MYRHQRGHCGFSGSRPYRRYGKFQPCHCMSGIRAGPYEHRLDDL
jgi:hypothetical protein